MEITKKELNIGGYKLIPIPTGVFGLDGGAMFGTVPKVLWEKTNPADETNKIEMQARALLLIGNNKKILIDTGNGGDFVEKYGEKLGSKFAELYGVQGGAGIIDVLKTYNIKTSDITDVILTHLHFDHAGGATSYRNGQIVPTFENATYYVQEGNLKTAQTPNIRERASYLSANFQVLIEKNVLKVLNGEVCDLLPNISVKLSHGHTSHQQMVIVSDNIDGLVYAADVIPTSSHVRLAWVMGYDLNPLQIIEEKKEVLKVASSKSWKVFFEHDPYCDYATVIEEKGDFKVLERFNL